MLPIVSLAKLSALCWSLFPVDRLSSHMATTTKVTNHMSVCEKYVCTDWTQRGARDASSSCVLGHTVSRVGLFALVFA